VWVNFELPKLEKMTERWFHLPCMTLFSSSIFEAFNNNNGAGKLTEAVQD
jgi:hypothetical protein